MLNSIFELNWLRVVYGVLVLLYAAGRYVGEDDLDLDIWISTEGVLSV